MLQSSVEDDIRTIPTDLRNHLYTLTNGTLLIIEPAFIMDAEIGYPELQF